MQIYCSQVGGVDGWGRIEIHRDGMDYRLRCVGVADFHFTSAGDRVTAFPCANGAPEIIDAVRRGPVRALLLELRGLICLHASSVLFGGAAVGFVGHSGSGKSTLAAACVAAGHALLTDDVLAIDVRGSQCAALPGDSRIRLRPHVAHALKINLPEERQSHLSGNKLPVSVGEHWGEAARVPSQLRALYVLDRHDCGNSEVRIHPIRGGERVANLIRFSYCASAVRAMSLESRRFPLLSVLGRNVPVCRLQYPAGLESLDNVRLAVSRDLDRIT
jgi:hypothetical protein